MRRGIQSLPLGTMDSRNSDKAIHKQRKSTNSTIGVVGKILLYFSLVLLIVGSFLYTNLSSLLPFPMSPPPPACPNQTQIIEDLYLQMEESQIAVRELEALYENRLKDMRAKLTMKEQENHYDNNTQQQQQQLHELDKKMKVLDKNHELILQQNQQLKSYVSNTDYNRALEKYGPGPHRVEFLLDFLPSINQKVPDDVETTRFVIEMAPLSLMPHTVFLFLQQVSHGLFNGTSFYRNAGHVVQGGPVPYYKNPGERLLKKYRDLKLDSVAFQEYHPDYPHKKHTLGYAGRPGGTDFYVSTIDNTLNHGPGGQAEYAIPSEADPCFAKVIEGFEAIDRMEKMPVEPGSFRAMKDNVGIVYARLLE